MAPASMVWGCPEARKAWAMGTPRFGPPWAPPMTWDPLGLFILQLVYIPRGYPMGAARSAVVVRSDVNLAPGRRFAPVIHHLIVRGTPVPTPIQIPAPPVLPVALPVIGLPEPVPEAGT
ncbi:hypothetical protein B0H19DRAFT_1271418 [Mycena capillaripes]|nr:hypothetical protein B0H19DRAFT_1271418 [Mycena capillaripes]